MSYIADGHEHCMTAITQQVGGAERRRLTTMMTSITSCARRQCTDGYKTGFTKPEACVWSRYAVTVRRVDLRGTCWLRCHRFDVLPPVSWLFLSVTAADYIYADISLWEPSAFCLINRHNKRRSQMWSSERVFWRVASRQLDYGCWRDVVADGDVWWLDRPRHDQFCHWRPVMREYFEFYSRPSSEQVLFRKLDIWRSITFVHKCCLSWFLSAKAAANANVMNRIQF